MSRTGFVWAAATAALLCWAPPAVAAASLRAVGTAAAGAYRDSDQDQGTLTPTPDSLTITLGASASDAVTNDNPPPDRWEMGALFDGIGVARYGSLAGRAHAEASSTPANTFFLAGGEVSMILGFTDGAEVLSDTLDPGTPVRLTFRMTLDATAVHSVDGPGPNPDGTGAAARLEVEVRDPDNVAQPPGEGALLINSRGTDQRVGTLEFDTAIGRRVELVAELFVAAGVDVDFATYAFSGGSADVVADQTAELFYEPSGDVQLASDSGHDYAVPEPGRGALLVWSATLVLLRHRRNRRPGAPSGRALP